jgi:hypothetical protein
MGNTMNGSFIVFIAVLLSSCSCNGGILNPPVGPNTDYPCGTQGRSCGNGMCCGRSEFCGGPNTGCLEGYCCPIGDDFYAGRKKTAVPQYSPKDIK